MCARCAACLASALAPGDRSYQDNMVLLTEIGFLSESLVQECRLKGEREAADSDKPFSCFSVTSACFIVFLLLYLCLLELHDCACVIHFGGICVSDHAAAVVANHAEEIKY